MFFKNQDQNKVLQEPLQTMSSEGMISHVIKQPYEGNSLSNNFTKS